MDREMVAGLLVTGAGVVGYVAGVFVPYPGRAFSITAVMLGITLLSIAYSPGGDPA